LADAAAAAHSGSDEAELWRTATTQVRDTIKYVVAGFAAVGAILVGTAPLAGLGTVSGGWWLPTLLGATIAVGGVIYAVWKSSDVLMPAVATLDDVGDPNATGEMANLRDKVLGGPDGLFRRWGGTVDNLRGKRELEYATLTSIRNYTAADETEAKVIAQAETDTMDRLDQIAEIVDVAVAGAGYATVRDTALDRRKHIAVAAVLVALGVALFTWGVTQPDDADDEAADPTAARAATLTFTPEGRAAYADLLGPDCAGTAPALVVDGDEGGPWEVVTTGSGGCRAAHFELAADQGQPVYSEVRTVTVTLTEDGQKRLAAVVGEDCAAAPFAALDLGGDDSHQIVALAGAGCRAARFTLTEDEGSIEPS
jgi:hypothetical protein